MSLKIPHSHHAFFILFLIFPLLFLSFHRLGFFSSDNNDIPSKIDINGDHRSSKVWASLFCPQRHHRSPPILNRKVLIATSFDFTPFQRHRKPSSSASQPEKFRPTSFSSAAGNKQGASVGSSTKRSEIDLRFSQDKRLVPTGPNPLHH